MPLRVAAFPASFRKQFERKIRIVRILWIVWVFVNGSRKIGVLRRILTVRELLDHQRSINKKSQGLPNPHVVERRTSGVKCKTFNSPWLLVEYFPFLNQTPLDRLEVHFFSPLL